MNLDEDRKSPLQVLLDNINKVDNQEVSDEYMLSYTE
jgi:hypothetical protein